MADVAQTNGLVPYGDMHIQYAKPNEIGEDEFGEMVRGHSKERVEIEPADAPSPLQKLFTDPEKMLKMWVMGETKPNPFAQEQKDPMESFGKFMQSMLMQTQTEALTQLKETMIHNNKYASAALIGEMVEIESEKLHIATGHKIIQNFTVPEEADAFLIEIKNTDGDIVYNNIAYNPGAGINQFEWSGLDSDGRELPVGEYSVSVALMQKEIIEGQPPQFKHLEYAKDLDGNVIKDKTETLSRIDREVQFSYEIPDGIPGLAHASVWITNSKGMAVHKGEMEAVAGKKGVYTWDCLDRSGHRVPEDVYTITFNFKDEHRKMLSTDKHATIRVAGKVQGIEVTDKGEANLVTSRVKAPLSTVKRIVNEQGL